jgi:hypothetical protein
MTICSEDLLGADFKPQDYNFLEGAVFEAAISNLGQIPSCDQTLLFFSFFVVVLFFSFA